jgi:HK97 family phage portal protein
VPSILTRLRNAADAFLGREERLVGTDLSAMFRYAGQPHHFQPEASLEFYGENPWFHAGIDVICFEVSRTPFFLEEKKGDDWDRVEKHESLETLHNPMPGKTGKSPLTQRQLFHLLGLHHELNGEAFWMLDGRRKLNGAPTIIHPLLPGSMTLHFGADNSIDHYEYQTIEHRLRLAPEDVVHFKMPNPMDMFRGHSPVKSARYALDAHKKADQMNLDRMENNAIPSGVLSTEQNLTPEERQKILSEWMHKYSGQKGKTAMLPKGLTFTKVQESNADMQYAESKKMNRDEILANMRIGLEMLGRTESQTRANADAAIYVFQRFTVLPLLEMITDTLNNDYLPQFPGHEGMRFNFPDPVPENTEEKRQTIATLMENASLLPDEARQMMGLEPLDLPGVTDIPYVNFNKVPAGASPEPPANLAA